MKLYVVCLAFLHILYCQRTKDPYPELTGPVIDPSVYLPLEVKSKLETMLLEAEKATTNQVVVFITKKLNEDTIEKEAIAVFEKWKLGQKDKDNGILFLLAPNERKVRIEVGYGLESVLTDLVAKRIIDEIVIPNIKSGNPSLAMLNGTSAILEHLHSGSPNLTNQNCPNSFSDTNGDLHPDTIPFLQREIKSLKSVDFYFCILPLDTQFGVEAATNKLYLHRQKSSSNTKSIVFVTSPNSDYLGSIVTSHEFNWSLSQNKIRTIFRNRYQERHSGDFTNFTYRAFLDMLDHIKHNQKFELEKGTGIFDPYDALETFSFTRTKETIQKLENKYKVGIQILLLDTKYDLSDEAKNFHNLNFGKSPGITLLFSLNQKKIFVFTDEYSIIQDPDGTNPKTIINDTLNEMVNSAIASDFKSADIDWMSIRSAEGIDSYLNHLQDQKSLVESRVSEATIKSGSNEYKMAEAHFIFNLIFALMFFVTWVGLASGEGILFFYGLFYIIGQIVRGKLLLIPDSPNLYQMILLLASAILSYLFVTFFRKIGWANKVSTSTQDFFTPSSSSSGSNSGSSYRSSSSSYSGGGGRSGGGGASGSW
ncbi:TPM domain-containing protein [Leptospira biflexa]|uniref:TPM domain-containing protein n=1 Tax=Leptospira biflexa TaxID=172 RepID=UPI001083C528|nr:TPM domain-containing protein [Leptospira biflexa]TGM35106.1 TPM domain-containing protein [Leptospira biflexa]TGM38459.1 TPM domain-containing protein [Leptospira biflexa]